ncbi:MAG TPA: ABC transporter permease [Spirochaetia bacterium]|nr:ABC transporter permease [Spirochaetia bacterium]
MTQLGGAAGIAAPEAERRSALEYLKGLLDKAGPIVAILILGIFLSIRTDRFLTAQNFTNIVRQAASIGLISIGMMLAILTGGIDLSVGALMALSTILMGKAVQAGWPGLWPVLVCLASGFLLGAFNGLLLTKLKLPHPFISTMGTQNIFRGACLLLTAGTPISGMPPAVKWAGSSFVAGALPVSALILILVYLVFGFFLRNTTLGRHIYVVGGNTTTARLSGVNVDFTLVMVYALSGLMCGLAGLVLAGRVDAVYPMAGIGWETDAIAAVIIGGSSFFGGRGNILGTFSGLILISVLRNGLNLMNITPDMQTVILGTVIILAVFIDVVRNGGFAKVKKL